MLIGGKLRFDRLGAVPRFVGPRGLVYLNNRHHDPTLGAFISVDPVVVKTGEPYVYGSANPITYSDPSGLEPRPIHCRGDNCGDPGLDPYHRGCGGYGCGSGRDLVIDLVGDEMIATLFSGVGRTKASDAGRAYEAAAQQYLMSMMSTDDVWAASAAGDWNMMVGNMPIEYIPLRYLLAAMPTATVDSIHATSAAIYSGWGQPPNPNRMTAGVAVASCSPLTSRVSTTW